MTCICEHVKAEHLLTGQCYQCECPRYLLDINADKDLIQNKLKDLVKRRYGGN